MAKNSKSIRIGDAVTVRRVRGPKPGTQTYYWRAERYVGNGQRETVWTGWGTRQEAQQHVAGLLASGAVEDGPARRREYGAGDVRTVRDLVSIWFGTTQEDNAILAQDTIDGRKVAADRVVKHMGGIPIPRLGEIALTEYRDRRLRSGAAGGTVSNEVRVVRQAHAWAKRQGLVTGDLYVPRNFIDPRPVRPKPTPTIADLWRIADWMRAQPRAKYHGDVAVLVGATGMRIGAAATLTAGDVRRGGDVLVVTRKGESREVPLSHEEREVVLRAAAGKAPGDRLFPKSSAKKLPDCFRKKLRAACVALGIDRFTPHGFRRMVIEHLLDKGIDVGTVAALVGNSPATIYRYYRAVRPEQKRRAVAIGAIGRRPKSEEGGEVVVLDRKTG